MDKKKLKEMLSYIQEFKGRINDYYKSNPGVTPFQEFKTITAFLLQGSELDPDLRKLIPIKSIGVFNEATKTISGYSTVFQHNRLDDASWHLDHIGQVLKLIIDSMSTGWDTIFYSWQSDLPNPTNRSLIRTSLDNAIKGIKFEKELRIDHDTRDVPGIPDITDTILKKIDTCLVFVADISIVAKNGADSYPNPNVLFELGYALKSKGPERIIMVFNENFGEIKSLPFDLNFKRHLIYNCSEEEQDKPGVRKKLEGSLRGAIETILKIG